MQTMERKEIAFQEHLKEVDRYGRRKVMQNFVSQTGECNIFPKCNRALKSFKEHGKEECIHFLLLL